jgi:predicted phage tail protein
VGFLSFTPTTFIITGAALLLSAFHGRQKAPGDDKNKRSLIFGGSQTTNREGGRVPIIYGIPFVGGMIVSASIKTTYTPLGGSSGGGGKGGK